MDDDLPPIRSRAEIYPAVFILGDTEMHGESIQFDGSLWLVLTWQVQNDHAWMQPARIVRVDGLRHAIVDEKTQKLHVYDPLPEDARPPQAPIETAKMAMVIDFPRTIFEAHRRQ